MYYQKYVLLKISIINLGYVKYAFKQNGITSSTKLIETGKTESQMLLKTV